MCFSKFRNKMYYINYFYINTNCCLLFCFLEDFIAIYIHFKKLIYINKLLSAVCASFVSFHFNILYNSYFFIIIISY